MSRLKNHPGGRDGVRTDSKVRGPKKIEDELKHIYLSHRVEGVDRVCQWILPLAQAQIARGGSDRLTIQNTTSVSGRLSTPVVNSWDQHAYHT